MFPLFTILVVPSPGFPPNSFTLGAPVVASSLYANPNSPIELFPPTFTVPSLFTSEPFTA